MHANLAVTEWDIPVRRGVNIDRKITLLGKSRGSFLGPLRWYVPVREHLCPPQRLAQVEITWVILGCQFNADSVFNLSSCAFRARVNTAGVFVDRSHIKIWRDLAARRCCIYPISSLWPHPPSLPVPPSWCFCECSLCLFICFALSPCWLRRPSLHPACFSQSCTQMFSSVFNFTVSHINPNKHTNLCFLPHSLSLTGCCDDAGWRGLVVFLQMINSSS